MALDEARLRAVHETVRRYFKSGVKSANKLYLADEKMSAAAADKHARRQSDAIRASMQLDLLSKKANFSDGPLAYGFAALDQDTAAGNCLEMATAAGYLIVRENIGAAWLAGIDDPGDHTFCLVGQGIAPQPETVADFLLASDAAWVIDPWANLCCPQRDYPAAFAAKMRDWSRQGKRISVVRSDGSVKLVDPADPAYLKGFSIGPVGYYRMDQRMPRGTPKGLARAQPAKPRTVKKHGSCVIL